MPMSNAERQARFRERRARAAAYGLTATQAAARDAVIAEPLYPVPVGAAARANLPRFMGWERYEWAAAPVELVDHFGMREAWEGWRREAEDLRARAYGDPR